jgi:tetratricopeptide (TPR) repeat protein
MFVPNFFRRLLLLPAMAVSSIALAVPTLPSGLSSGGFSSEDYDFLQMELQGRPHAEAFRNVTDQLRSGNVADARLSANRVLRADPNSSLAHEVLAVADLLEGEPQSAIDQLKRAAALTTTHAGPSAKLGYLLMENGQIEDAELQLLRALEIDSKEYFAHRRLGLLYDYKNDGEKAVFHLSQGIAEKPTGYVDYALVLIRHLLRAGQAEAAVQALEPRVPESLDRADAQAALAHALLMAGKPQEALARFETAAELEPLPQYQLGKAVALRQLGETEKALGVLEELERDTHDEALKANIAFELGQTLQMLERSDDAIAAFERSRRGGAGDAAVDEAIAKVHLDARRFREARKIYESLIAAGTGSETAYVYLSEFLVSAGEHVRALEVLSSARQRFRSSPYIAFRLGSAQAMLGQYGQAVATLKEAEALAPTSPHVLRALSLAQTRTGDLEGALASARKMLELSPDDVSTIVFTADAYERNGNFSEAQALYEKALEKHADNALVLNNLANIYAKQGDLASAEPLAQKAVAKVSNNGQIMHTLGYIQLERGEHEAAIETLTKAIELSPKLAVAYYHLGVAQLQNDGGAQQIALEHLRKAIDMDGTASWAEGARSRIESFKE